jgi:hypothetical protein
VRRLLRGAASPREGREIDAPLVTAGINNLNFSDIVEACASNDNRRPRHTDCVTGFAASRGVSARLHSLYDRLAGAIADRLPRVREVYINNYPNRVFAGGGCGSLGFTGAGIDHAEGEAMITLGETLNSEIAKAVRRHRDQHWNLVEDLVAPFAPHAYCAGWPGKFAALAGETGGSWFTYYERSWTQQGNKKGTAHPNRAGHVAFAGLQRRQSLGERPDRPPSGDRLVGTAGVGRAPDIERLGDEPAQNVVPAGSRSAHAATLHPKIASASQICDCRPM